MSGEAGSRSARYGVAEPEITLQQTVAILYSETGESGGIRLAFHHFFLWNTRHYSSVFSPESSRSIWIHGVSRYSWAAKTSRLSVHIFVYHIPIPYPLLWSIPYCPQSRLLTPSDASSTADGLPFWHRPLLGRSSLLEEGLHGCHDLPSQRSSWKL